MKILKKFFKRKTPEEKKAARLLKENNCVCYCKECHGVLDGFTETDCDGVYRFECSQCSHIGYFDYCHPAPLYLSEEKFESYRDFGIWDPWTTQPRTLEVKIPKGFMNVKIPDNFRVLTADTNDSANWDEIKIPLTGKYKIKSNKDNIISLEKVMENG